MPTKGWTGLKSTRLNDGSHRVIKLVIGSPSATSGDIQIGGELIHVDDIEVSNLPIESIDILLSGPQDSNVCLYQISLGGVGRDVFLNRIAWDKTRISISWSRAVNPTLDEKTGVGEIHTLPRRPGRPGTDAPSPR